MSWSSQDVTNMKLKLLERIHAVGKPRIVLAKGVFVRIDEKDVTIFKHPIEWGQAQEDFFTLQITKRNIGIPYDEVRAVWGATDTVYIALASELVIHDELGYAEFRTVPR